MSTDTLLDALHQRFREAFKSDQPQALKAVFSAEATILPPNRGPLVGYEAILGFWEQARRIRDVVFEPAGSQHLGDDVLRETGTLHLMLQGQGPRLLTRDATYLSIWRRIDGAWRLDSIMWRLSNAGGGPRAGAGARTVGAQGGGNGADRGLEGKRQNRGNRADEDSRGTNVRGFGPRARRNRVDQQAPMVPKID